ncbi:MAG: acylphosphatase [Candidatus Margulisiibacteriota bacterium]|nr:acylphosphatase [Candidatus Margulisiibacteriota bacterium]
MKRIHAYYSGDVHGVGFRFTAVEVARRYKITGWVRNSADGRVELVAEGKGPSLDSFLKEIKTAMAFYIREEVINPEPAAESLSDFQVRY